VSARGSSTAGWRGAARWAGLPLAVLAVAAAALFLAAGPARAAGPTCSSTDLYVVAHEDDTLLFQSPAILQAIESGHCVRSVFLTAGDAGKGPVYWNSREEGVEAAYAQIAGVEDEWSTSAVVANGHSLVLRTLAGNPRVTVVFVRLPDGDYPAGTGYPLYGNQSLMKLWNGGNKGSPSETSITAVDKSNTFEYSGLLATLTALMQSYEPNLIATQDFTETFSGWDHYDHVAAAYFTRLAQRSYAKAHQLLGYEDYPTVERPANVFEGLLEAKRSAFYLYGLYDEGACSEEAACNALEYGNWLKRQYVAGRETTGVVGDAGYAQTVEPGALVHLSGSASSDQSGHALTYSWAQVGGSTVALSGAQTATPSFSAPSGGSELTFSLVVRDGVTASAAATVTVAVEGEQPAPVAVPGAPQTVASGAAVALDGSGSYDPEGEPLT
jgi:LmbE family N-acetylglucosaminyl deacetylase